MNSHTIHLQKTFSNNNSEVDDNDENSAGDRFLLSKEIIFNGK